MVFTFIAIESSRSALRVLGFRFVAKELRQIDSVHLFISFPMIFNDIEALVSILIVPASNNWPPLFEAVNHEISLVVPLTRFGRLAFPNNQGTTANRLCYLSHCLTRRRVGYRTRRSESYSVTTKCRIPSFSTQHDIYSFSRVSQVFHSCSSHHFSRVPSCRIVLERHIIVEHATVRLEPMYPLSIDHRCKTKIYARPRSLVGHETRTTTSGIFVLARVTIEITLFVSQYLKGR